MGTYKVIQDIEAEDKLLGPLTLKQFIFVIITLTCGYLSFMGLTRGAPWVMAFLLPPMIVFGFLGFPWKREQPTEVWLAGKLRFILKPRKRIWDQSGLKTLVTITAPKVDDKIYTNGLSEGEVQSRLKALANTIDSRGWAVKNINVNLFNQPQYSLAAASDRLIDPSSLPQEVGDSDVTLSDDILDEENNPTAQNLERMIHTNSAAHRQELLDHMHPAPAGGPAAQPADYWFMNQPSGSIPAGQAVFDGSATVQPDPGAATSAGTVGSSADEQAALQTIQSQQATASAAYGHMKTINPLGTPSATSATTNTPSGTGSTQNTANGGASTSSQATDPAILELANNDDLNVATIARQANKHKGQDLADGEVVISLR